MKPQLYSLVRGSMEPATNGPWCKYDEDLEKRLDELDKENNRLKEELWRETDARGSDYFAYLDMKKYAYRVGHKDECFTREKRVAELESALKSCHNWHTSPYTCANMVDKYYHKLFPKAYNPHNKTLGGE
jgi:hypothetical protein